MTNIEAQRIATQASAQEYHKTKSKQALKQWHYEAKRLHGMMKSAGMDFPSSYAEAKQECRLKGVEV